jgi:glycosyltransferase involved in cell wall biosynthesis
MRIVRYYPRALVGDGGITSSVWHASRELCAAGADVILAFDQGAPSAVGNGAASNRGDEARGGIELRQVEHRGRWRAPVGLDAALAGSDVLVLHSAWTYHNVRAGAVARSIGVPYVLEPRGAYDPWIVGRRRVVKKAWWWLWERQLVEGARAVHLFFESEVSHLTALGYRGEVVVAPNGVLVPDEAVWDGGSGGYVLWYGRFDLEHKGIDLLVRALALLSEEERPPLRLHGPDARARGKERIRRLVHELGLERWVTIGEPVHGAEKWNLLARARGFAYPSRWEAFGNAVAEAAAVGVPILTTPYPLGRYLAERGAAIVVEPTPRGLADGMRRLLAPEAAELGQRARPIVRREFAWDRVSRDWLQQVERLL